MDLFDVSGQKLREVRDALGWSRDFLCEKSGVPVRTIQDIENGTVQNPGVETVKRLIEAMVPKENSSTREADLVFIFSALPALNQSELRTIASDVEILIERKKVREKSTAG